MTLLGQAKLHGCLGLRVRRLTISNSDKRKRNALDQCVLNHATSSKYLIIGVRRYHDDTPSP
jgi:hypothetical protein